MKSLHGQPPQSAELAKGLNGMAAEPDTDGVATSGLRTLAPAETAELLHRLRTNVAGVLLGTQNPFEFEGTYPLPESQLDRFLMRLHVGYPDRAAERDILLQHRAGEPVETMHAVLKTEDVLALQARVRQIRVEPILADYIL